MNRLRVKCYGLMITEQAEQELDEPIQPLVCFFSFVLAGEGGVWGSGGEYLTLEGLSRKVKILFDNRVHRAGQNGYFSHDFNMVKIHQKTKIS